jgi:hypothetical protein
MKENKKVKEWTDVLEVQSKEFKNIPHGWIQWKGTDACIDLHCSCGAIGHLDGWFLYTVKCGHCGKCYAVDCHVQLIEIGNEPENTFEFIDDDFVAEPKPEMNGMK